MAAGSIERTAVPERDIDYVELRVRGSGCATVGDM